jgi:hypothetical protein
MEMEKSKTRLLKIGQRCSSNAFCNFHLLTTMSGNSYFLQEKNRVYKWLRTRRFVTVDIQRTQSEILDLLSYTL